MNKEGRISITLDPAYADLFRLIQGKLNYTKMIRVVEEMVKFYIEMHPTLKAEFKKMQSEKPEFPEETKQALEKPEFDLKRVNMKVKRDVFDFLDITG